MATKAKERPTKPQSGDRGACILCNPKDRIPHWRVWTGEYVLNDGVAV